MSEASNIDHHLGCGLSVPPDGRDAYWMFGGGALIDPNLIAETLAGGGGGGDDDDGDDDDCNLIAETLGGEKSVGEEARGVVICQPVPPSLSKILMIITMIMIIILN